MSNNQSRNQLRADAAHKAVEALLKATFRSSVKDASADALKVAYLAHQGANAYFDAKQRNALSQFSFHSALVLDLDGDGVEVDALTYFDHEDNDRSELSRWASEDDGVLVWDKNNDGVINDGSELFGSNMLISDDSTATNGFTALTDLDSNEDGVINSSDKNWAKLRVMRWTDANSDGIMQDSEKRLETLDGLGIASLNTSNTTSSFVDKFGNEHRQEGRYTKKGGAEVKMTDVSFVAAPGKATYSGVSEQSVAIKKLPDIKGGGRVYDLRDAMVLDDAEDASGNSRLTAPFYGNTRTETKSLREMVEKFVAKDEEGAPVLDEAARRALAEKILLRWAGAESVTVKDYRDNFRGSATTTAMDYADARQIAVVEAFEGGKWRKGENNRNPDRAIGQKIQRGYMNHLERLYGQLMLGSHFSDLQDKITIGLKSGAKKDSVDANDYEFNFSAAVTALSGNATRRSEFLRSLAAVYGEDGTIISSLKKTAASWVYEYEYHAEYYSHAVFGGLSRNLRYNLYGTRERGRDSVNVFRTTGGTYNVLQGRGTNETYQMGYGTGHDTVSTSWPSNDFIVKLAPGISTDKIKLWRTRDHLIVSLYDADGRLDSSLKMQWYYLYPRVRLGKIMFQDGTIFEGTNLQEVVHVSGQGTYGADTYDGAIDGASRFLQGGRGADVYLLGRGSGSDTVQESVFNDFVNNDKDVVRLKSGLTADDVRLSRTSSDLLISVLSADKNSVDSTLRIKNHYLSDVAKVERVELSNGTLVWGAADLNAAVFEDKGRGDDSVIGTFAADTLSGYNGGNDTLRGGGGSDVYLFGGGSGNDIVDEEYRNFGSSRDVVRLKKGIVRSDLSLSRNKYDLIINLQNSVGVTTDTLTIKNYYVSDVAKVERVELSNGTLVWGASDFAGVAWTVPSYRSGAEIADGAYSDNLRGQDDTNDVFDGDAGGNDHLYGRGGDDVYWLGKGTGHDTIYESGNSTGDVIKLKEGVAPSSVRLLRNGSHLVVELLDTEGVVSDSLTVVGYYTNVNAKVERLEFVDGVVWGASKFMSARIRGGRHNDSLYGRDDTNNVFDGDAGGDDHLYGYGGDDVYWLGKGTGHDTIYESGNSTGDVIKLKEGIASSSVRLLRNGSHLVVELLDTEGVVSDSLTVDDYYVRANARVDRLEFSDGVVWGASKFMSARIRGGKHNDSLYGNNGLNDVFDGDAGGNDNLYGEGGDDVYWLGRGTGHDVIYERYNSQRRYFRNDMADVIKLKEGITSSSVRLSRTSNGLHLVVGLLDSKGVVSDSLTVVGYYSDANAKVERLEFSDGTAWGASKFMSLRIRGGEGDDNLQGRDGVNDVFDGDAGGNDHLYGIGGDDVYWFGKGTGHDAIYESGRDSTAGDVIKLKKGIASSSVRLSRTSGGGRAWSNGYRSDLVVELLNSKGIVSDSLTVVGYYSDANAKVERLEFSDGTVWGASKFMSARIHGGEGDDNLRGRDGVNDVFDGDAGGNDHLYGKSGDDVYWLGRGTGHDTIYEHDRAYGFLGNDDADVIKLKEGITSSSVRLLRDGSNLVVELLDSEGIVSDSLTVHRHYSQANAKIERLEFADGTAWGASKFMSVPIRGESSKPIHRRTNLKVYGRNDMNDVFDADTGGNDKLYGRGGDDVYWLGKGTGHDRIYESGHNSAKGDVIKLKEGITSSSVRLSRDGSNLVVELLDSEGIVSDSLTVLHHYSQANAKIERLEFADGASWGASKLMSAPIRGDKHNDTLSGVGDRNDVFDADTGGNDTLWGRDGDDVYWLGKGTGHDSIKEYLFNTSSGDSGDVIKLKEGITSSSVRLLRDGSNLVVELLDSEGIVSDSLTVHRHYSQANAKIERVEFADGTVWGASKFMLVPIRGNNNLRGGANNVFDGGAGGNDTLWGGDGDNVYWLGKGTGHDTIYERGHNSATGDVIKLKEGITSSSVRLLRKGYNNEDLVVQLLGSHGAVSDSLTVLKHYSQANAKVEHLEFADGTVWGVSKFMSARIRGGESNDYLSGRSDTNDVFDSDAGGNDTLNGYGGNDVYWLGKGTGHDTIREHYRNTASGDSSDVIKLKEGITSSSVRLSRISNGSHLVVELLDSEGGISDSLTVEDYYTKANAKVERLEFADGAAWGANKFMSARIRGGKYNENLYGRGDTNDVFDSDLGGNDTLYGYGGDDVYWLGRGTGHDTINEHHGNASGDVGDVIKLKEGITSSSVRLLRDGSDLVVQLLDSHKVVSDSLTVEDYYTKANAKIERLEFADGRTVWRANKFMSAQTQIPAPVKRIRGSESNDSLHGRADASDVFDADAGGDDILHGLSGDDVYWLGKGTGHDTIREYHSNKSGDSGDVIKVKSGIASSSVRLFRSNRGTDLVVRLLDSHGEISDSLRIDDYYVGANAKVERLEFADGTVWGTSEFMSARIRGGESNDYLRGRSDTNDVFDGNAGGNDFLYGYGGNDVYWLGKGTGHDTIREHYSNASGDSGDVIKLKDGIASSSVRLFRSNRGTDLVVQLLDSSGDITDSLRIDDYYVSANAKVERLEFADGTVWDANKFMSARIQGGESNDYLQGRSDTNDVFDSDAGGNDTLNGYGGNDVYWLGKGTGHDTIREHYRNTASGDSGDVIKLKSKIALSSVRLLHSGNNLVVQIVNSGGRAANSLTVENHFSNNAAKVERIEAGGKVLLEAQYQNFINDMAAFTAGTSTKFASEVAVYNRYWSDDSTLSTSSA